MSFAEIDPIFQAWAQDHGLEIYNECKDIEVRSVRWGQGRLIRSLSVDPLSRGGTTVVRIGILRKPSQNSQSAEFEATIGSLREVLDQAYMRLCAWERSDSF